MKKSFLVLPLVILLANCSSTRNTSSTSANTGINASASTATNDMSAGASTSGSMASGSTATSATSSMNPGSTSNWKNSSTAGTASSGTINWDVYDPNNYMQNPEKYRKPYELGKAGGWTYTKDWRRNTNFTPEAVGQWQLVLTPEVAANWMPDTRRPETYASFWTPEAVMGRYQAAMAAAAKTQDSLAALNPVPATNNKSGRRGSSLASNKTTAAGTWGSTSAGTTGTGGSAAVTGSGTTGSVGTGGLSPASTDMSSTTATASSVTVPFAMTATNGNNFLLPTLNMFIDNGSFTAYTGCNSAVGNIVVNGSSLHFEETTPSTNVECIGGFDQSAFIDRLRRADSYDVVNNQFRLKQGDQVLMVFAKSGQGQF